MQSLKFENDPYGSLLFTKLDDLEIKFDPYSAKIVNDKILISFSYTFEDEYNYSYGVYEIKDCKDEGVLLSFDDYFYSNWEKILPVFDHYGVKATFFCMGTPTRTGLRDFIFLAQTYGMECGYHSKTHKVLTNLNKDEVYAETVEPLKSFEKIGIYFNTISLPGGGIPKDEEAFNVLKENFKIVRGSGLGRVNLYYSPSDFSEGFMYGDSFDQLFLKTDEEFKNMIKLRLIVAKMTGKIWTGFGHYFVDDENGETKENDDYTIKISNLKYMLELINTLKLKSYLYKDFY